MANFQEPDRNAVRQLLRAMEGQRVLVVGDGMLDAYLYGASSRLSPEAPVPIDLLAGRSTSKVIEKAAHT